MVLPDDCYISASDIGEKETTFAKRLWSEALMLEDFLIQFKYKPFIDNNHFAWQDGNGYPYIQPEVIFHPEAIQGFMKILV